MSAIVREEIAAAATTVPGVQVSPYVRQALKPGLGAVHRAQTDYPNKFGGTVTWQVLIVLPSDIATAEKWIDENTPLLVAAFRSARALTVQSCTPMTDQATQTPVLVIQGIREE